MKKEFVKKIIIVGIATLIITNMYYIPASAEWINSSKNNWNWVDGEVKATGWKEIDEKWYYFNEDGIMSTGWINYNGKWYNLSSSGTMETGWKEIDEKWYYFNEDGIMSTGWLNYNGKWYNLSSSGTMSIGWIDDNGTWYFTNSSGEMETGTLGIDGQIYTFSDSGAMLNNKETIQNTQPVLGAVSNVKNDKNDSQVRIAYVSTNSDSLNIRSGASTSSDIIGTLANGTKVNIIDDEKNGFYQITANGTSGWASSKWISLDSTINEDTSTSFNSNSNEDVNTINNQDVDLKSDLNKGEIRNTEPSLDDKHYYSDMNLFYKIRLSPPFSNGGKLITGNCTWYAWGRAWEITGSQPNDAGFIGDAYEWWEENQESGKYQYGSEPRVGAISVWKSDLPNSGGCGHVAVVEKIENGKIYISESMWDGATFEYREIYQTSYLYGYIYLDKPNY